MRMRLDEEPLQIVSFQNEKGPGIAARPHCAEYGFAGVRSTQSPKAPRFSILTHQLRRRFRSGRILGILTSSFVAPSRSMACFPRELRFRPEGLSAP